MNAGGFLREQVVDVVVVEVGRAPLAVPIQMVGELPMRVPVIEESERVVESLSVRLAGRARLAEAPLADDRRAIPRVAQHLRDRHVVWPERDVAAGRPPLPRIQAWPVCSPVMSAVRDGAHTVLPA